MRAYVLNLLPYEPCDGADADIGDTMVVEAYVLNLSENLRDGADASIGGTTLGDAFCLGLATFFGASFLGLSALEVTELLACGEPDLDEAFACTFPTEVPLTWVDALSNQQPFTL